MIHRGILLQFSKIITPKRGFKGEAITMRMLKCYPQGVPKLINCDIMQHFDLYTSQQQHLDIAGLTWKLSFALLLNLKFEVN